MAEFLNRRDNRVRENRSAPGADHAREGIEQLGGLELGDFWRVARDLVVRRACNINKEDVRTQ